MGDQGRKACCGIAAESVGRICAFRSHHAYRRTYKHSPTLLYVGSEDIRPDRKGTADHLGRQLSRASRPAKVPTNGHAGCVMDIRYTKVLVQTAPTANQEGVCVGGKQPRNRFSTR